MLYAFIIQQINIMTKLLLFAYGTLQHKNIQLNVFNREIQGESDQLIGYEMGEIHIDHETYPAIKLSKNTNAIVKGTVYEIDTDDLMNADEYEGCEYERIKVQLASGRNAWVYILAE